MRGVRHAVATGTLIALAAIARPAWGETCRPLARLDGDPELVAAVGDVLRARAVPVAPGDDTCGEVVATLHPDAEARVRVAIVDADGRQVERIARDADAAATAIESWTRPDLADPLLAARAAPRPVAIAPGESPPDPVVTSVAAAPHVRRAEIAAALEAGVAPDGSLWRGVRAAGCFHLGAVCVGALARFAEDTLRDGDAVAVGSRRSVVELSLIAAAPRTVGALTLTPAIGLGQASFVAERRATDTADLDEDEHDESSTLHLRGSVGAQLRVTGAWAIRADVALGWAPRAPEQMGELDNEPDDEAPLAGAPRTIGWLGLGLAYEGL
jgi:hypothetical protein